jgi:hypothetical protein
MMCTKEYFATGISNYVIVLCSLLTSVIEKEVNKDNPHVGPPHVATCQMRAMSKAFVATEVVSKQQGSRPCDTAQEIGC